jgi:hypothetical protein
VIAFDKLLEERVRQLVTAAVARPALVHQNNVEQVIGLPRRLYLAAARAGHFGSMKERRLVVARTEAVLGYYEAHITMAEAKPANAQDAEAQAFGRVGARRVER